MMTAYLQFSLKIYSGIQGSDLILLKEIVKERLNTSDFYSDYTS
nr:hypothetical protein [Borreliella andersonii]WNY69942.1 hypothetical protein QIA43_04255 [Borreliella andersonii]